MISRPGRRESAFFLLGYDGVIVFWLLGVYICHAVTWAFPISFVDSVLD